MEFCVGDDESRRNTNKSNTRKRPQKKIITQINDTLKKRNLYTSEPKKKKMKSVDSARGKKRPQLLICSSSSSECVDEFTPSKSEYLSPAKHQTSSGDSTLKNEDSRSNSFDVKRFFEDYSIVQTEDRDVLDGSLVEELSGVRISDIEDELESHEMLPNSKNFTAVSNSDKEKMSTVKEQYDNFSKDGIKIENLAIVAEEFTSPTSSAELFDSLEPLVEPVSKYSKVKYYNLEDSKLVILSSDVKLPFYGIATVSVLYGKIEVFGVIMDEHNEKTNIYSPRGTSLLYIKNINTQNCSKLIACLEKFSCVDVSKLNLSNALSVILCQKLIDPSMINIEKHISQQILPNKEENLPQCIFDPKFRDSKGIGNVIETSDDWDVQINNITSKTKIIICGGKGVGKSTFLRYCVNRLLMKYNRVNVIDLDPGQSEFTVPGCISVVTVKQPLLGPNYTHLQKPEWSILSNINVAEDPTKYLKSVKELVANMKPEKGVPILINYMGFSRGIGLNILSSVISIIKPTDLLVIQSQKSHNNFKQTLLKDVVKKEAKLFSGSIDIPHYNLIILKSLTDSNEGWSLVPRQMREMCFLAYFGTLMNASVTSNFSPNIPAYETELSNVNIVDIKGNCIPPIAAVANVVTLCSLLHNEHFIVHGWGIVRGMDIEKDVLILSTPLDESSLERVTHIVDANVKLPPSVIMTTDNVFGLVPYIHEGDLPGSVTKRSYLPPSKRC